MRFRDRIEAGRRLAGALTRYANRHDVVVLALPRGGVPVGFEVAQALRAPLDIFLVRKLGVPGHPELAMGAIATGGVRVLSEDLIAQLDIPRAAVEQVAVRERLELERRDRLYRGGRPLPQLRGRTVILVDDGLATGATMETAIEAVRVYHPTRVVVAAPVCARDSAARLNRIADQVVCAETPEPFQAVGFWYEQFEQTTDEEVVRLLETHTTFWLERDGSGENGVVLAEPRPFSHSEDVRPERRASNQHDVIRSRAQRLSGDASDYDPLIEAIGDARIVLIGEATHGTHEFYQERAAITERLISEQGFGAVAVEADWPDAYRVNRYVRGESDDRDSVEALGDFGRFPTWMWRNTDVVEFIAWLRADNDTRPADERVGFYGIDLFGDARATEMGERGELNVGQLVREKFGADAVLIGQTTHSGTVTAASEWDLPAERKTVRPSMTGSYERLFHDTGMSRMLLPLRDDLALASALSTARLERAIGVIYLPLTERRSHYFVSRLANQFDFVLHIDETTALEPLERTGGWETGEAAETFPSGL